MNILLFNLCSDILFQQCSETKKNFILKYAIQKMWIGLTCLDEEFTSFEYDLFLLIHGIL